MASRISIIIGPPGCGKTREAGLWCERAATRYGFDRVIVCGLTRTTARNAARRIELPPQQFGTVHAFAYRALGGPVLAESKIAEWNAAFPAFALSGALNPKTPDDGFQLPDDTTYADKARLEYSRLRTMRVPRTTALWQRSDIAGFVRTWEDWKQQNHYLDFTDLIEQALAEVDTAPGEPAVIIVDEAQDTGSLEMQLLQKWAEKAEHLAMFGDPGQALFSWRGTSPILMQNMRTEYDPDRKILGQSYRVPRQVYEYAYTWQQRFRQTLKVQYEPRKDEDGKPVEGLVEYDGTPFNRWTPESVSALVEPFLGNGKTVMFEATCGYMLDTLIDSLRGAGIPFANPYRPTQGKWNPLPRERGKGFTVVDRVLAFSAPRRDLWGDKAHFWGVQELKAWVGGLPVTGIFQRGAQTLIKGLKDDTEARVLADSFPPWFLPAVLPALVPKPDLDWYLGQVKGSDRLRDYVKEIIARYGVGRLAERPRVTVGTVHSLKGSESDIVVLCPDLSLEAYNTASADKNANEELKRLFYVGVTRAKEHLILCKAGNRLAVEW